MFATITQIDHDTWKIHTDALGEHGTYVTLNTHRKATDHFSHSRTHLGTMIDRIVTAFVWATQEYEMMAENLVINFGDETTWHDHVWAIADRIHPGMVQTRGTTALYSNGKAGEK